MELAETYAQIAPGIVAFGSRLGPTPVPGHVAFPRLFGTGFVIDSRGIVLTNRHIADALMALPKGCAMCAIFPAQEHIHGETHQPVLFRGVRTYSLLESFEAEGPFYGQVLPDMAFVQIDACGLTPLEIEGGPSSIRIGTSIATAGFAMGTTPITMLNKVTQLTPVLRHGVISSVFPFSCPHPHGFTIDVTTQGGESGSPIFLPDSGKVVGLLHAGLPDALDGVVQNLDLTLSPVRINANSNITLAIPGHMLHRALEQAFADSKVSTEGIASVEQLLRDSERVSELRWETHLI
jgi:Trypsin-like peptidase domain